MKRYVNLRPWSREHQHGLSFCRKIRTGLEKGISTKRIQKFVVDFWDRSLKAHFESEERLIFPLLGSDHELIQRAMREHRELKTLICGEDDQIQILDQIASLMHDHIRFEERILFNAIESTVGEAKLSRINAEHEYPICPVWEDPFWLNS